MYCLDEEMLEKLLNTLKDAKELLGEKESNSPKEIGIEVRLGMLIHELSIGSGKQ